MDTSVAPVPPHDDTSPSPLPVQMPSTHTGKRRVKKTEKARALEENTDSDGPAKKGKERKGKTPKKKKCLPRARATPIDADSDDSQGGDDDDAGGKIE
jgi:hypothetical protein